MTVLKSGDVVGSAIGQPTLLELMRVESDSASSHAPMMMNSNQDGGGRGSAQHQNSYNKPGQLFLQLHLLPLLPPHSFVAVNGGSAYHGAPPPSRPGFGGGPSNAPMARPGGMSSPGGGVLSKQSSIPISGLSPYQSRWTIRARVASKPSIRTWSNSRGEGRVFNVDLVDETVSGC